MSANSDKLRRRLALLLKRAAEVRANSVGRTQDVAAGFVDGLTAAIAEVDKASTPAPNGDRWIVVSGTPLRGFLMHGPFASWPDANAWGEQYAARQEFWIAPLMGSPALSGPTLAVNNDSERPANDES